MAVLNFSLETQLAYKIYPIKILDLEMTEKHHNMLPYPYLAPYKTREEGQH